MIILILLIAYSLEQFPKYSYLQAKFKLLLQNLLGNLSQRLNYIKLSHRLILTYFSVILPTVIILLLVFWAVNYHPVAKFIFKLIIFLLTIEVYSWKRLLDKQDYPDKAKDVLELFLSRFFAPLFWFLVFPFASGSFVYLVFYLLSVQLKNRNLESMGLILIVDRILFYLNILPACVMLLFLALSANFEAVALHLLRNAKSLQESYYYLNTLIYDTVFLSQDFSDNTYLAACLYRLSIFFTGSIVIFFLLHYWLILIS